MAKTQDAKFVFNAIPNKSQRAASQLRDGLRVLNWTQFRQDNKAIIEPGKEGGFAAYAIFDAEWKKHPCHQMGLPELDAYITKELGYTLPELNEIRSKYYENKQSYTVKAAVTPTETEEIPY